METIKTTTELGLVVVWPALESRNGETGGYNNGTFILRHWQNNVGRANDAVEDNECQQQRSAGWEVHISERMSHGTKKTLPPSGLPEELSSPEQGEAYRRRMNRTTMPLRVQRMSSVVTTFSITCELQLWTAEEEMMTC